MADSQLRWLLWQLEEHHQVEDHHYFPVFRRAEPRLAAGLELLERDHAALRLAIGGIIERANLVLANDAQGLAALRADLARFRAAHVDLGRELIPSMTTRISSSRCCWSAASSSDRRP